MLTNALLINWHKEMKDQRRKSRFVCFSKKWLFFRRICILTMFPCWQIWYIMNRCIFVIVCIKNILASYWEPFASNTKRQSYITSWITSGCMSRQAANMGPDAGVYFPKLQTYNNLKHLAQDRGTDLPDEPPARWWLGLCVACTQGSSCFWSTLSTPFSTACE